MKKGSLLTIVLCAFFISACRPSNLPGSQSNPTDSVPIYDYPYSSSTIQPSSSGIQWPETTISYIYWLIYYTLPELDENVDYVFEGKVVNITFGVQSSSNPGVFITTPPSDDGDFRLTLYTIYEIEVASQYKGNTENSISLAVEGGILGYKEQEQFDILTACGWPYNGLQLVDNAKYLEIGKTYLFSSFETANDYLGSLSPYQFALEPGEVPKCGQNVLPSYDEIIAFYKGASDENNTES